MPYKDLQLFMLIHEKKILYIFYQFIQSDMYNKMQKMYL